MDIGQLGGQYVMVMLTPMCDVVDDADDGDNDDTDIYIMMQCVSVCHEKSSLPPGSLL